MAFNTALSGIRAANDDLSITGNNIANASTNGFKKSRAEFGDVYASSIGSGNSIGSGVRIQDVSQQFSQGNISFTENVLDLAVSGSGYFVTNLNGDQTYTRAGAFGLDDEGYVTNNVNARLQGFVSDTNGNLSSLPSDIQISSQNLQPDLTTLVESEVNLDSRELPPQTAFTISAARIAALDAGGDIDIGITNPLDTETLISIATTAGTDTATTIQTALNDVTGIEAVVNGSGDVEIILAEGYSVTTNPTVSAANALTETSSTALSLIGFDVTDSNTYSHSTAVTIYDSLGNPHVLQQFFIKQPYDSATTSTTTANHWQMVVQVDGENVGDVIAPATVPSLAVYDLYFTSSGQLDEVTTGDIEITNWEPLDANGNPLGAIGPPNSNFNVTLTNSTQISGDFEVRVARQNGTTTGRLSGLSIDDTGNIFARYTNGQNRVLAQVALADFTNSQGLEPIGDTAWAETYLSGAPIIGEAGTASLGLIQSGALEESNVDLSEQLVNLIIAQRNFQASAKTIETADQTTQTIINLR